MKIKNREISANQIEKVLKDRINHLKSDIKSLKNVKMDSLYLNPVREVILADKEIRLDEIYWVYNKLGLNHKS